MAGEGGAKGGEAEGGELIRNTLCSPGHLVRVQWNPHEILSVVRHMERPAS